MVVVFVSVMFIRQQTTTKIIRKVQINN